MAYQVSNTPSNGSCLRTGQNCRPPPLNRVRLLPCRLVTTLSLHPHRASAMPSKSKQKKGRDVALSTLDGVIQVLGVAKDACGVPPAQIALGSACVLLTTIKVRSPSPTASFEFTCSCLSRTRWAIKMITSILDCPALRCAKRLTGD